MLVHRRFRALKRSHLQLLDIISDVDAKALLTMVPPAYVQQAPGAKGGAPCRWQEGDRVEARFGASAAGAEGLLGQEDGQ